MNGAIPLLSRYAFIAWTRKALPFTISTTLVAVSPVYYHVWACSHVTRCD